MHAFYVARRYHECIELAKEFSTEQSPAFVNGVLGNIVRDKATLVG